MDTSRALSLASPRGALPAARHAWHRVRSELDGAATRLLGRDFDERIQRVSAEVGPGGVDPFGLDPDWVKYALAGAAFLHRVYFRSEVQGVENIPDGRVLLIANHSGQVPIDGAVIAASVFLDRDPPRIVRSMVEKWAQTLPFVSTFFGRCGQVVGVPENARRLLELGEAILVFPEGTKGISKPFSQRYKLSDFGLGFMRLALETRTPIVPVALVGAEEQYVSLANVRPVAKLLGMPSFPVIPQLLVPGGQLPLPTKYRIRFGEPLSFEGDADDDDALIEEKVRVVKATIQAMLHRGLKERKGLFF